MDWEMLLELLGQRQKEAPPPARAEAEIVPFPGDTGRPTQVPTGGGAGASLNPARGAPDLMEALYGVRSSPDLAIPALDRDAALAPARFGRDAAVSDMQTLEAAREARFGPAPPPSDPEQAALLERATSQAGAPPVPNPVPTAPPRIGLQPEMLAALGPGPSQAPPQPQVATNPSPATASPSPSGPQATAPNIDLGRIFAEVMRNLGGTDAPMAPTTSRIQPASQPAQRPGVEARRSAAAPAPFPFPVFAPPRTTVGAGPGASPSVMPPPAARTDPAAQIAPQHFQFPFQTGPSGAPPPAPVQARAPAGPAPTQIGAGFRPRPAPAQSSADVLNLAEAARLRGGATQPASAATSVPFDQSLPGLPSNVLPGPSTGSPPADLSLRSGPKPTPLPPNVLPSSVQPPKTNATMGTEPPPNLKEALLAEALRLSQRKRTATGGQ